MEEAAVTQKKGTHARLACNECHAPHNLLVKLPFKAQEGLRDFWGNITGKDVPHPVSLHTRDVVNANCKAPATPRPTSTWPVWTPNPTVWIVTATWPTCACGPSAQGR